MTLGSTLELLELRNQVSGGILVHHFHCLQSQLLQESHLLELLLSLVEHLISISLCLFIFDFYESPAARNLVEESAPREVEYVFCLEVSHEVNKLSVSTLLVFSKCGFKLLDGQVLLH
jgi:hypothetical protein